MTKRLLIGLLLACSASVGAWEWWPLPMAEPDTRRDSLFYVGSVSGLFSSGEQAPSLLWHTTDGAIASHPHSGNLSLGIIKPATRPNRWFDYDFGVVLSGRISGTQRSVPSPEIRGTGFFNELYAHVRLYIVDITAGIHPWRTNPGDDQLTSGSLLFSGNAHPIPRISIGLDRWTPIPGLFGYVEVRGGLTHGWLGDNSEVVTGTLLHYKFIGGQFGGKLPVNVSYEFHHVAQWGGYSSEYGDLGNDFKAWKNAFLVRSGGSMANDQINAQGNHIGMQQLALTAKGKEWKVTAYWQCLSEDGPIHFMCYGRNQKDGLWGVNMTQSHWPFISGFTYEFIHTTDQAGPWHDKDGVVYGGADGYYGNSIYKQGWSYYGNIIGNPLLSLTNNRVRAHYAGVKGDIYGFQYRAVVCFAQNYGRYRAPAYSENTAIRLDVKKHVEQAWGLDFGISLSGDFGTQYGNTFGAMVTISKKGIIKQW
ncbi:MAG: hypothetical protein IJS82_06810 [Paludibacteraceae bacterium]|nr:hypothetical protein [Paludibacteraceae bacterium]